MLRSRKINLKKVRASLDKAPALLEVTLALCEDWRAREGAEMQKPLPHCVVARNSGQERAPAVTSASVETTTRVR
jgi:hypothetical protein